MKKNRFELLIILSFAILLAFSMYHHEIWGDEMESWNMARNSTSLTSLYYNIRYGGNPGLWHFLMYLASFISRKMVMLKVLNYIIAVLAVVILVTKSPFRKLYRALIPFGYFFVYEYGTISRHYALTTLLFLIVLTFFKTRWKNTLLLAICIVLLSLSSPYGALLALGATFSLTLDYLYVQFKNKKFDFYSEQAKLAALLIMYLGIFLSYALAIPPEDGAGNYQMNRSYLDIKLVKETVSSIWESYVPVPQRNTPSYWNSNFVDALDLRFIFSIALFGGALFLFRKSPRALVSYGVTTAILLGFSYVRFSGAVRHEGHLFLAFLGALWIFSSEVDSQKILEKVFTLLILLVQVGAAFYFVYMGTTTSFYNAVHAASYLKENGYENWYFIGDDDGESFVVTGFLDKEIYFPRTKRESTFLVFDQKRFESISSWERTLEKTLEKYQDDKKHIVLILTYEVDESKYPVKYLAWFEPTVATKNPIYLYEWVGSMALR